MNETKAFVRTASVLGQINARSKLCQEGLWLGRRMQEEALAPGSGHSQGRQILQARSEQALS